MKKIIWNNVEIYITYIDSKEITITYNNNYTPTI